jgi:hypothetical protein
VGALIPYSLLLIVFLDAYEYSLSTRIEKKTQEYEWDKRKRKKEEKKKKSLYAVWSLFIDNYIEKRRCNLLSNLVIDKLSFGIYRDIKHIVFFLTSRIFLSVLF